MKHFQFNQIYIIESLPEGERHTGCVIYEDVKIMALQHEGLDVRYKDINNIQEWDGLMDEILADCCSNGKTPILHLEIHGEERGKGLVLKNKDFVPLEHVGHQFRQINVATGCNLFLTLGVCKGLYLLFNIHPNLPMPFIGAVGSFDNLNSYDIECRYFQFYDTFFNTLDIAKAYVALINENTGIDPKYRYIAADEIFYKCYQGYIKENCSEAEVKNRASESIREAGIAINRNDRRKKEREYVKLEKKTRKAYYMQAIYTFFDIKHFPDNLARFDVPLTFKALEEKCKHLTTI